MTPEKELLYKKAYVELYETLKFLDKKEKNKIPSSLIENIEKKMDKNYLFQLDKNKSIFEQNYMDETKALFVELYERYYASLSEKNFWNKYDNICMKLINTFGDTSQKQDELTT